MTLLNDTEPPTRRFLAGTQTRPQVLTCTSRSLERERERLGTRLLPILTSSEFTTFYSVLLCVDGASDTPSSAVTKQTYFPSLLYFHEEIMHTLNVTPTIPKTEPDRRDLMIKEVEKASNWSFDKNANVNLSLVDRITFSISYYGDKIIRFLRIDKL